MTLICKIIKHEHIQQNMVGRVEKYEQISKYFGFSSPLFDSSFGIVPGIVHHREGTPRRSLAIGVWLLGFFH